MAATMAAWTPGAGENSFADGVVGVVGAHGSRIARNWNNKQPGSAAKVNLFHLRRRQTCRLCK